MTKTTTKKVGKGYHPNQVKNWIKPGQVLNPGGRPKTFLTEGREFLKGINKNDPECRTRWALVVARMYSAAMNGSVPAAGWLRDTFIGKPKETLDMSLETEHKISIELIKEIREDAGLEVPSEWK